MSLAQPMNMHTGGLLVRIINHVKDSEDESGVREPYTVSFRLFLRSVKFVRWVWRVLVQIWISIAC